MRRSKPTPTGPKLVTGNPGKPLLNTREPKPATLSHADLIWVLTSACSASCGPGDWGVRGRPRRLSWRYHAGTRRRCVAADLGWTHRLHGVPDNLNHEDDRGSFRPRPCAGFAI